jgi:hypothetical protein
MRLGQRAVVLAAGEEAEQAEGVELAAVVGVGEVEGAKAPRCKDGEGRHELGRGWREGIVQRYTLLKDNN